MNTQGFSYTLGEKPQGVSKWNADQQSMVRNAITHLNLPAGKYRAEFGITEETGKTTYIHQNFEGEGMVFYIEADGDGRFYCYFIGERVNIIFGRFRVENGVYVML